MVRWSDTEEIAKDGGEPAKTFFSRGTNGQIYRRFCQARLRSFWRLCMGAIHDLRFRVVSPLWSSQVPLAFGKFPHPLGLI
jgi:hypothetical protein